MGIGFLTSQTTKLLSQIKSHVGNVKVSFNAYAATTKILLQPGVPIGHYKINSTNAKKNINVLVTSTTSHDPNMLKYILYFGWVALSINDSQARI